MKKFLLLLVLIVALSCQKEEPITSQTPTEKALWVKFDAEEQPFNTNTILNPEPTWVSQDGEWTNFSFYIDNNIYADLQIDIHKRIQGSVSTVIDSFYTIGINISEAIVRKQDDGHYLTAKYLRNGNISHDSVYHLTFESEIISPFTDTVFYNKLNWNDSRFFEKEDDINLLDTTFIWDDKADRNGQTISILPSDFYLYRDCYTEEYNVGAYGSYFQLNHDYHNGIKGESNKVFVFRWRNNNSATGYYYGWIELSLTENREFTIHKVVYQVD